MEIKLRYKATHKCHLCSCPSGLVRGHHGVVKHTDFGDGQSQFKSQLPTSSHMTLGMLLNQPGPPFLHLNGDDNYLAGSLKRLMK